MNRFLKTIAAILAISLLVCSASFADAAEQKSTAKKSAVKDVAIKNSGDLEAFINALIMDAIYLYNRSAQQSGIYANQNVQTEGKLTAGGPGKIRLNKALESTLKRFKRSASKTGTIGEIRKREHYEKPSMRRKKKAEAARKRRY